MSETGNPSLGQFDCPPQEKVALLIDAANCLEGTYWPIVSLLMVFQTDGVTPQSVTIHNMCQRVHAERKKMAALSDNWTSRPSFKDNSRGIFASGKLSCVLAG